MTNAKTVETALNDAVSANFTATPNDKAPEGAAILGGVVYKGGLESGASGFQAVVDGIAGEVKKNFTAAINAALTASNNVAANYDTPAKWSDVHVANKEPEIENFEDLEAAEQKAFKAAYKALGDAFAKDERAIEARRAANFAAASVFVGIRDKFASKKEWGLFKKFAPEDHGVKAFLGGKNAPAEYYKAGRLLAFAGFEGFEGPSKRAYLF